jgi:predicted kinase
MSRVIIVCGQTGAGKTTYSLKISNEINGVKFSIDPWMQNLFSKDMDSFDFDWMMERIERCQIQIWEIAKQIIKNKGNVVLDLGFTTKDQRKLFINKAKISGIRAEIHYIDTPVDVRKQRVIKRNTEKDPEVYAFEVTDQMFEFMEPRFEPPSGEELNYAADISDTKKTNA